MLRIFWLDNVYLKFLTTDFYIYFSISWFIDFLFFLIYVNFFFYYYYSKADAEVIFRDARLLNMTDEGYVWIVTEQALEAENVPVGVLGLKLVHATNEKAHIKDSM